MTGTHIRRRFACACPVGVNGRQKRKDERGFPSPRREQQRRVEIPEQITWRIAPATMADLHNSGGWGGNLREGRARGRATTRIGRQSRNRRPRNKPEPPHARRVPEAPRTPLIGPSKCRRAPYAPRLRLNSARAEGQLYDASGSPKRPARQSSACDARKGGIALSPQLRRKPSSIGDQRTAHADTRWLFHDDLLSRITRSGTGVSVSRPVIMPTPVARSPPIDHWNHGVTRPLRAGARHNPAFGIVNRRLSVVREHDR